VPVNSVAIDNAGGDGNSWTYASATWRMKNNSASNRVSHVDGLGQSAIDVRFYQYVATGSGSTANIGVVQDSTTAAPNFAAQLYNTSAAMVNGTASFPPSIGFHFEQVMEARWEGGGTDIFFGMRDGSQTNALVVSSTY